MVFFISSDREYISRTDHANYLDIPCLIAHVNGDTAVDGADLAILATGYGWVDCSVIDPCSCDFDKDGVVDEIDLNFFTEDYGLITECD